MTMNNKAVNLGYLDFQKAFDKVPLDKVPHKRLMAKVNAHGIHGDAERWMRKWLARCHQRACTNQT